MSNERTFVVSEDTQTIVELHMALQRWEKSILQYTRIAHGDDESDTCFRERYEPHLLNLYNSLKFEIGESVETNVDINRIPKTGEIEI